MLGAHADESYSTYCVASYPGHTHFSVLHAEKGESLGGENHVSYAWYRTVIIERVQPNTRCPLIAIILPTG